MKKLIYLILLLPFVVKAQTTPLTVTWRGNTAVNALDSIAYTYSGINPTSSYKWLYPAAYIRTNFAKTSSLSGYVPTTRSILNGYGIIGGTGLNVDITKSVDTSLIVTKTYGNRWLTTSGTAANSYLWNSVPLYTTSEYSSGTIASMLLYNQTNSRVEFGNVSTIRSWLNIDGLGDARWLLKSNNLSDLASPSTARTNLGGTTAGQNFFTLTNPSAITFPRINADNTVSALNAADFRVAIGAGSGGGSVTSVSALTIGTTGTDLSSSVANSTTTPVITLNVPTASASNRGALSSTDWSTFNNKQSAITFGTGVQSALGNNIGSAGAPVLFNGAGGTPSSITLTNATGTANGLTAGNSTLWGGLPVYSASLYSSGTINSIPLYNSTNSRVEFGSAATIASFISGQSFNVGKFLGRPYTGDSNYAAFYSDQVTPTDLNFSLISNGASTVVNGTTDVSVTVNGSTKLSVTSNGASVTGSLNLNTTQTTTSGSTSGSIVASMPFQGATYKKVIIYCNGLNGTATYNYPTTFTYAPSGSSSGIVGTINSLTIGTTSLTIDASLSATGFLVFEGY